MGADDRVLAAGVGDAATDGHWNVEVQAVIEGHAEGTFTAVEGRASDERGFARFGRHRCRGQGRGRRNTTARFLAVEAYQVEQLLLTLLQIGNLTVQRGDRGADRRIASDGARCIDGHDIGRTRLRSRAGSDVRAGDRSAWRGDAICCHCLAAQNNLVRTGGCCANSDGCAVGMACTKRWSAWQVRRGSRW